jgi:signal transduction histidine kinase
MTPDVNTAPNWSELFGRAPVGLVHVAADGGILAANAAFARLVGVPAAESVVGRAIGAFVTAPDAGRGIVEALAKAEPGTVLAAVLRGADGASERVEIVTEGRAAGDGGFVCAVTAAAPRPHASESVGLIAGGVAHHLNNEFAIVMTNAALLAPRIAGLPPDNGDFLNEIVEAVTRAAAMIQRLLAVSRRQQLARYPLALGSHLRALVSMVECLLPASIVVGYADRTVTGGLVQANAAAIERILVNLGWNARDAMPEGGALEISCEEVVHEGLEGPLSGEVPPGHYVLLTVADTGVGMDAETRRRLFEPFFTTKPHREGAGLGLATVFGLVRQHDGYVTVESAVGTGTTVRVWLPGEGAARSGAARATPAGGVRASVAGTELETPARVAARAEPAGGARKAILLVEDEVPLRVAAQKVLERLGYRVLSAGDGEKALRLFHAHEASIGLVITDLMMPGLGGRGLFEALRAEGKPVPVVFMSGYASADLLPSGGLDPTVPFLEKPWKVEELVRVVNELVGPAPQGP